jgi:5,10-methylene-tetrahydrofolate dehydrogenase/methenyl tetrahydrofolate cyclohydrolase
LPGSVPKSDQYFPPVKDRFTEVALNDLAHPGKILDGRLISAAIREELKADAQRLKARGIVPGLSGILVGEDPGSVTYVGLKSKACEEIGIQELMCKLPENVTEAELFKNIDIRKKGTKNDKENNCNFDLYAIFNNCSPSNQIFKT